MYAPGERYHYGTSNDYLGLVVEAASGLSLGDFMKKNIFEYIAPLWTLNYPRD